MNRLLDPRVGRRLRGGGRREEKDVKRVFKGLDELKGL